MTTFYCPHCRSKVKDAVIMHYIIWHPAILDERMTDEQVETALRNHFFPRAKLMINDALLTCVAILSRLV